MGDITDLGAVALSQAMAAGEITSEALMAATLARIEAANGTVNAIVSLREPAHLMEAARKADAAPRAGWLHGIPLAIKDMADVAGLPTTQGSPLFRDHVPASDSGFVRRLKAAGGIVIGKTNVPEFALGSHTVNPVFGATVNPYAPGITAGGSSGGAGAALATRMISLADGSDMMGSLRNPAAWNNVYGYRPTWGRVPGEPGDETYLHRISTAGPMARTVEDIVALLRTMAADDPRWPGAPWPDLPENLDTDISGRRIAWLGDWGGAFPMEEGVLALVEAALKEFEELGAVVEPVAPPHPREEIWEAWTILRSFAIAAGLGPLYADPEKRARIKKDGIWEIERGMALSAMEVHRASAGRYAWLKSALSLFETYDAIMLPAAQVFPFSLDQMWPAEIAGVAMDTYHRWMEVMVPASLLGLPALGAPAGFSPSGLPMGLQIIGPPRGGWGVLQLGQAYHRATDWPGARPPAV